MSSADIPPELRRKCSDNALQSYGKAYIFEQRNHLFHFRLTMLKWLGIAVPLLVYGIICSFKLSSAWQTGIIAVASVVSTALLVLSAWAMAANWDEQYSKSLQSQLDFIELAKLYRELGTSTLFSVQAYRAEVARFDSIFDRADRLAMELRISDNEKRMGMRAALREFQRACVGCKVVPTDINSTNCDVCGNFKKRRL